MREICFAEEVLKIPQAASKLPAKLQERKKSDT